MASSQSYSDFERVSLVLARSALGGQFEYFECRVGKVCGNVGIWLCNYDSRRISKDMLIIY